MLIESVPHALQQLTVHRRNVKNFYADPLTKACGAPTGDFQRDFDNRERRLLGYLIKNAHGFIKEDALLEVQKFMP